MSFDLDRINRTAERLKLVVYGDTPDDPFGESMSQQDDTVPNYYQDDAPDEPALGKAWAVPAPITDSEMLAARIAPRCIVKDYLFADVAALVAPGSTGKTTATLYEAICIVLGIPAWGLTVESPGPVLIVTAEDRREFLVARIREIMRAMHLDADQRAAVMQGIRIDDRTTDIRRLTVIVGDVVMASDFGREIVTGCQDAGFAPSLVQFDPLVSFGVGSARVNDSEQGLIEAGRIISGGLDCCARYIHHVSKIAAQAGAIDQYAARGGTALPDGSRMVAVMAGLNQDAFRTATGHDLDKDQSALLIARPKLSYAPPQPGHIYVRRTGYQFERIYPISGPSAIEAAEVSGNQIARYIESQYAQGVRHTRTSLAELRPENMTRAQVRTALLWLESNGRLREEQNPPAKGGAKTCLRAVIAGL